MAGARALGDALAVHCGLKTTVIGRPEPPIRGHWDVELAAARPALTALRSRLDDVLARAAVPLTTMGRCASALATLPAVARANPEACIVWFDAHADSNTPATSDSGYLGGMVLTGAAGQWHSGLGDELQLANVVLAGSRDIDPAEQALIDSGALRHVAPGEDFSQRLVDAVGGRPVYIHLDCDVLEPGIVPTEYAVPGGLSRDGAQAAFAALARLRVLGLEVAEFESHWPDGQAGDPAMLIDMLKPLLDALPTTSRTAGS